MNLFKYPPKAGVDLIKEFESFNPNAYPDPGTGGKPITIGWGSTRDLHGQPFYMGDVITKYQADLLLEDECLDIMNELKKIPYYDEMSENQVAALLSFAYNLGKYFYDSPGFNTITRRLKNREWDKVPDALLLYINPGSSVEAGLRRRRIAEGKLWSTSSVTMFITATVDTFLKKKTVQSSQLLDNEKVKVSAGKRYSISSITKENSTHSKVDLNFGGGTWYLFSDHWKVDS